MSMVTYVGLDVHLNSIAAVWGRLQEKPRNLIVPNTPEGREALLKAIGTKNVWAVYEASSCGFELFDELTRRGWKMSIVAPTHIARSVQARKRKTDLRDARRLWELILAHGELGTDLPVVWIPPMKIREDREVVRRRLKLAENLSRVKSGIQSLLRMHKVARPEELKTLWSQKHIAWLRGLIGNSTLGRSVGPVLASLVREMDFLAGELEALHTQVEALAQEDPYRESIRRMTELSGVGSLTAMTFLLELGDMNRFNNRRQVASYLGLVPASYESGEADNRKGHITRLGPARIRKVLNQAAWILVRYEPQWRAWYKAVAERRGALKAIVGVARRLGIELWHRAKSA
jgi:transposase